jgi:hypothetical protein
MGHRTNQVKSAGRQPDSYSRNEIKFDRKKPQLGFTSKGFEVKDAKPAQIFDINRNRAQNTNLNFGSHPYIAGMMFAGAFLGMLKPAQADCSGNVQYYSPKVPGHGVATITSQTVYQIGYIQTYQGQAYCCQAWGCWEGQSGTYCYTPVAGPVYSYLGASTVYSQTITPNYQAKTCFADGTSALMTYPDDTPLSPLADPSITFDDFLCLACPPPPPKPVINYTSDCGHGQYRWGTVTCDEPGAFGVIDRAEYGGILCDTTNDTKTSRLCNSLTNPPCETGQPVVDLVSVTGLAQHPELYSCVEGFVIGNGWDTIAALVPPGNTGNFDSVCADAKYSCHPELAPSSSVVPSVTMSSTAISTTAIQTSSQANKPTSTPTNTPTTTPTISANSENLEPSSTPSEPTEQTCNEAGIGIGTVAGLTSVAGVVAGVAVTAVTGAIIVKKRKSREQELPTMIYSKDAQGNTTLEIRPPAVPSAPTLEQANSYDEADFDTVVTQHEPQPYEEVAHIELAPVIPSRLASGLQILTTPSAPPLQSISEEVEATL